MLKSHWHPELLPVLPSLCYLPCCVCLEKLKTADINPIILTQTLDRWPVLVVVVLVYCIRGDRVSHCFNVPCYVKTTSTLNVEYLKLLGSP